MQILTELAIVNRAGHLLAQVTPIVSNSKAPTATFPAEDAVSLRQHRVGERITVEILPSPALLRWLAAHIEVDLARP